MCSIYTQQNIVQPLKREESLTHATAWMNLEDISLSEISQAQKDEYHVIPLRWGTRSSQIHRGRKQDGGYWRRMGSYCLTGRVSVLPDEKSSGDGGGDDGTTMWMTVMPQNCALKCGYDGKLYVMCIYAMCIYVLLFPYHINVDIYFVCINFILG